MRTQIKQHPERSAPAQAQAILSAGYLAHIAYQEDGQPYLIPMSYHYDLQAPDLLYLHGSPKSHTLLALAQGIPVCVEVSLLDSLVYSRTALHHSMDYRSVIAFGRGHEITDLHSKQKILTAMLARYFPGRQVDLDYQPIPQAHLEGTLMVAIQLEQITAKVRNQGANGPGDTLCFEPGNAGRVPLQTQTPDWRPFEVKNQPFLLSTDREKIQLESLFQILASTYWNQGLTHKNLALRIQNSLCFGLYHVNSETPTHEKLIGFARLVTDYASFAYLADVVIAEPWRGQGLGKWLSQSIMAHPVMRQIRWCLLSTQDAHGLYTQVGFQAPPQPQKFLTYFNPNYLKGSAA